MLHLSDLVLNTEKFEDFDTLRAHNLKLKAFSFMALF